jgi:hypothetical protein
LFAKLVVPVPADVIKVTGTSKYPVCATGVEETVHF